MVEHTPAFVLYGTEDSKRGLTGSYMNVSSRAAEPLNQFSPMFVWDKVIPVPGMPGFTSRTVEGVWQGLKVIEGKIEPSLFDAKRVRKRSSTTYSNTMFRLGSNEIDLVSAREQIYKPTYRWVYDHLIPESTKAIIMRAAQHGTQLVLYDADDNPDPQDSRDSYSHASFLVEIINEALSDLSGEERFEE